jgi:hypothetical protein
MLYGPRDLTQELEDQGNSVHLEKDEYGGPIYRIILADGKLYRLSAQEMYDLKDEGRLSAAGIQEHDCGDHETTQTLIQCGQLTAPSCTVTKGTTVVVNVTMSTGSAGRDLDLAWRHWTLMRETDGRWRPCVSRP